MHHVKTQAPYALLVGLSALFFGDLLSGYLYPMWAGALPVSFECFVRLSVLGFARVACNWCASVPLPSASCSPGTTTPCAPVQRFRVPPYMLCICISQLSKLLCALPNAARVSEHAR